MPNSELVELLMRRAAARRPTRIFKTYARLDVDATTKEGAEKIIAGWAVAHMAIATLADRPVTIIDKPTKDEAADALAYLLIEVPNNLPSEQVHEALRVVDFLSCLPAIENHPRTKAA